MLEFDRFVIPSCPSKREPCAFHGCDCEGGRSCGDGTETSEKTLCTSCRIGTQKQEHKPLNSTLSRGGNAAKNRADNDNANRKSLYIVCRIMVPFLVHPESRGRPVFECRGNCNSKSRFFFHLELFFDLHLNWQVLYAVEPSGAFPFFLETCPWIKACEKHNLILHDLFLVPALQTCNKFICFSKMILFVRSAAEHTPPRIDRRTKLSDRFLFLVLVNVMSARCMIPMKVKEY